MRNLFILLFIVLIFFVFLVAIDFMIGSLKARWSDTYMYQKLQKISEVNHKTSDLVKQKLIGLGESIGQKFWDAVNWVRNKKEEKKEQTKREIYKIIRKEAERAMGNTKKIFFEKIVFLKNKIEENIGSVVENLVSSGK